MSEQVSITKAQLVELMTVLPKEYRSIVDLAVPIGYRLKLFGLDWRSMDQLAAVLAMLHSQGILELHPSDKTLGRLSPRMYCHLPHIDSTAAVL